MHLLIYVAAIVVLVIAFSIFFLLHGKKDSYTELYNEGIKKENNGYFTAALEDYNKALAEVEKYKFQDKVKDRIIQKIKVLKSTIEYESH